LAEDIPKMSNGAKRAQETSRVLTSYVDDYLERMRRLTYDDLARRQEGRLVSLAFGAAGIAYAHWHVAAVGGDLRALDNAERWSRAAWVHRGDDRAFFASGGAQRRHLAAEAFLYGEVGLCFLRVLMAQATGAGDLGHALDRFAAAARAGGAYPGGAHPGGAHPDGGSQELYAGAAGRLQATAILLRATGDERLLAPGRELAAGLQHAIPPLDGRSLPWRRDDGPGLAHGTSGVLFALLSWFRAAGEPVPEGLARCVAGLVWRALAEPARFCPRPTFEATLCNGFAGLGVLALEAAAALAADAYLAAAGQAAERALRALPPRPDLCCGRAGVASLCLALAAAQPGGPWLRHARQLVLSSLLADAEEWEVAGLYGGEAALPCLAVDLLRGGLRSGGGGPPALVWPAGLGAATFSAAKAGAAGVETTRPEPAVRRLAPGGAA
jgi:hypothetical protein